MGTRFLATHERHAPPAYKEARVKAGASAAGATVMAQYTAEMADQGRRFEVSIVQPLAGTFPGQTGQYPCRSKASSSKVSIGTLHVEA